MNFKKRVNGSWTDTSHYIHNTSTDAITTLPTVIYPTDTTATVGLKGQTLQSSIPSPTSPVTPQGTGERTGQLIDYTQSESGGIDGSGNYVPANNLWRSTAFTPIDETLQYFVSWTANTNLNVVRINYYTSDKTHISREQINTPGTALTIPQNAAYLKWTLYAKTDFIIDLSFVQSLQLMINTGSTALPYEPFGVKIPISSVSTTTPIYLGEVETTRKIKKLVLTGQEEGWTKAAGITTTDAYQNYNLTSNYLRTDYIVTHMPVNSSSTDASTHGYIGQRITLCMDKTLNLSDIDLFKAWLASEYSAGHPVTLYYVRTTPETAVVNEPLRKIGDYADTVSGITIPTIAGADSLDVLTTLKPSEVTVNYHGWHTGAVHERESGAWD